MNKGDLVFNKIFGSGRIVSINSKSALIKFDRLKTTRKIKKMLAFFCGYVTICYRSITGVEKTIRRDI